MPRAAGAAHDVTYRSMEAALVDGQPLDRTSATRRFRAKRRNERVKLVASAFDRISTPFLAGAAVAPIFQEQGPKPGYAYWIAVAIVLYLIAQAFLTLMRDES